MTLRNYHLLRPCKYCKRPVAKGWKNVCELHTPGRWRVNKQRVAEAFDSLKIIIGKVGLGLVYCGLIDEKKRELGIDSETKEPICMLCGKVCSVEKWPDGNIKKTSCPIHHGNHASGDYSYLCGSEYCRCDQ